MTLSYGYFRKSNTNPHLITKVHAFDNTKTWGSTYPICGTHIVFGSNKINLKLQETHEADLCGNCIKSLNKMHIKWWDIVRSDKAILADHHEKIKNARLSESVKIASKSTVTKDIRYTSSKYVLVVRTVNGKFKNAELNTYTGGKVMFISVEEDLVELFTIITKAIDDLKIFDSDILKVIAECVRHRNKGGK